MRISLSATVARLLLFGGMMPHHVWTIVLAAGAGKRLARLTQGVPKQYWRPGIGTRSLLQETLDRFETAEALDRTITVVDAGHHAYVARLRPYSPLGDVMYQPADRGTATGVLLPLATIAAASSDAIVVITPSDHGVEDARHFREGIRRAVRQIENGKAEIVLFGVHASAASTDFGWIMPVPGGPYDNDTFRPVAGFFEKPDARLAFQLFENGAAWNTMVVVARARSLLNLFGTQLPFHFDLLTAAAKYRKSDRQKFLDRAYLDLSSADFCRNVLTPSVEHLRAYIWPIDMGWSDLGSPDRLGAWLARQGRSTEAARQSVA
jgi:mannose-1-phosphate guanylyltransferase